MSKSDDSALRSLKGSFARAAFTLERGGVDEQNRTAQIAWASELPVERAWGREILDMRPGSVRLERLKDGAPLLLEHDNREQIGVVDFARIDPDRRGRATVRFSKSARAQEIFQDVLDGIRTKVSVGYQINDVSLESRDGDVSTYRVTDWMPFELSLVSLPADNSVGIGRAMPRTPEGASQMDDTKPQAATPAPEPAAPSAVRDMINQERTIREQAARDMAKRNADIIAMGNKFRHYGGDDLAQKSILDPQITFEGFREQLLDLVEARAGRASDVSHAPAPRHGQTPYGMGARDMIASANLQTFRGIGRVMGKDDHEVAYRAGMWARGVIFGDAAALGWCRDHGVQLIQGEQMGNAARTMTEGVFTSAGWLVPIEMESAIISNREQYGVARRICNVIPMGTASMTLPRVTSDVTAYFVGEGSTGTASDPSGDQVQLNLKDLMAYTQIGKSTAMDAVIPLAEMVAREQARAFAIKEDACLVIGDGTSSYGGMLGIVNLLETAAYAGGRGLAATNHDTFGEMDATDVAALIGNLPVYARAGARFVVSGVGEAMIFGRLKLTAGGQDTGTLQGGVLEQSYAGFPISVAHNMPAGATTDYSNKILALLGNFQLGVAFGSGSGMMLTVDPYTNAHMNLTRIITTERIDIVAHGVNKSTTVAGPICGLYGE